MADYPSGQRGLTVNQLALPSGVRIPHLPLLLSLGTSFIRCPEIFYALRFGVGGSYCQRASASGGRWRGVVAPCVVWWHRLRQVDARRVDVAQPRARGVVPFRGRWLGGRSAPIRRCGLRGSRRKKRDRRNRGCVAELRRRSTRRSPGCFAERTRSVASHCSPRRRGRCLGVSGELTRVRAHEPGCSAVCCPRGLDAIPMRGCVSMSHQRAARRVPRSFPSGRGRGRRNGSRAAATPRRLRGL